MPRFIRHPDLAAVVWLVAEAVTKHIDKRMDQIMGALVTVDSDVLSALTGLAQTVDTEVGQLIQQGKLAPGDVSGLQAALDDAKSQVDAAVAAGTATSPTDPSAPAGAGDTTPPTDTGTDTPPAVEPSDPSAPSTTDDSTTSVDPTTPPADGGVVA